MTDEPIVLVPDTYETLTDPDTGDKSLKATITHRTGTISENIIQRSEIVTLTMSQNHNLVRMFFQISADTFINFNVTEDGKKDIIDYLFGISEHFYTSIRILDVPDGNNQYSFTSTNNDVRVIDKHEVAGWEFKGTDEDNIHNLCITVKTGHTILIVLGIREYIAWESEHLGRFAHRYINYDGTVTDQPVYPPDPPSSGT